jgi:squalene-hopene/tetraprenyl-beta-curcumene cyclase
MRLFAFLLVCSVTGSVFADEITLENVKPPAANSTDEPLAQEFSLDQATAFLDQSALEWTKTRKCFTCHTNYNYLLARPLVSADVKAHQQVRQALEQMVNERWKTNGPRWDAEVVMSAAVLAMNDSLTSGKLDKTTRVALDRMWQVQREDGGFDWLKCDWPPMEIDDDYGIAIAALAAGAAPDNYAETAEAKAGLAKLRKYLQANPPPTLHHRAMLIWSDSYGVEMLTAEQRQAGIKELQALQKTDGGWSAATLADWQRADGSPQDPNSDAYGTAFVTYVLLRGGVPADDPQIQQGIQWLKSHQRASGRWYARSLHSDSQHFLSHAASAMAVMAIQSCKD